MLLKVALFLHIISAIFWIGGMLFLVLVIAPFLKSLPDPKEKSKIYQTVGKQYRFWGWVAIITLLITGPFVLLSLYPDWSVLAPSTDLGKAVTIKVALVVLIVLSSFFHDFLIGPKARSSPKYSTIARVFGRGNLLIALLIALFAVFIRLGGI